MEKAAGRRTEPARLQLHGSQATRVLAGIGGEIQRRVQATGGPKGDHLEPAGIGGTDNTLYQRTLAKASLGYNWSGWQSLGAPAVLLSLSTTTTTTTSPTKLDATRTGVSSLTVMDNGPAPSSITVLGTPTTATVSWAAVSGAVGYQVNRAVAGTTTWTSLTPTAITATTLANDVLPDPRQTYTYQVLAVQADGRFGAATANFAAPKPVNPPGLTAAVVQPGVVRLAWKATPWPPGFYKVFGPGLPVTGRDLTQTTTDISGVPVGAQSFQVIAFYQPGNIADATAPSTVSTVVRILPSHGEPWLGRYAARATPEDAAWHVTNAFVSTPGCQKVIPQNGSPWSGTLYVYLRDVLEQCLGWQWSSGTNDWNIPAVAKVVYANLLDLGVGRDTRCYEEPQLARSTCITSLHGVGPGYPGFAEPFQVDHAVAGSGQQLWTRDPPKWGSSLIVKDNTGTRFFTFYDVGYPSRFVGQLAARLTTKLDTEAEKLVPFVCMSCHGGRYNPNTKLVDGATLLPLDPDLLTFSQTAGFRRGDQEESLRKLNSLILRSGPSPAVAAYIRGLYGGMVDQAGARATPDYVPSGWSDQAGLYRSVVRKKCATCHMAQVGALDFATSAGFLVAKASIYNATCVARSMPHGELPFRAFWLEDTGPAYLPGLLAASLGYKSCP
jgi:hypothetical protein